MNHAQALAALNRMENLCRGAWLAGRMGDGTQVWICYNEPRYRIQVWHAEDEAITVCLRQITVETLPEAVQEALRLAQMDSPPGEMLRPKRPRAPKPF